MWTADVAELFVNHISEISQCSDVKCSDIFKRIIFFIKKVNTIGVRNRLVFAILSGFLYVLIFYIVPLV